MYKEQASESHAAEQLEWLRCTKPIGEFKG